MKTLIEIEVILKPLPSSHPTLLIAVEKKRVFATKRLVACCEDFITKKIMQS